MPARDHECTSHRCAALLRMRSKWHSTPLGQKSPFQNQPRLPTSKSNSSRSSPASPLPSLQATSSSLNHNNQPNQPPNQSSPPFPSPLHHVNLQRPSQRDPLWQRRVKQPSWQRNTAGKVSRASAHTSLAGFIINSSPPLVSTSFYSIV